MLSVLVSLVFAAGLFIFITVLSTRGSGVPSFFGYSFLNVSTGSMQAAYPVGTIVVTKKTDITELRIGDVISFYSKDPVIKGLPNTHRVFSIGVDENGKTCLTTKGDSNSIADTYPVYEEDMIGKVVGSIESVGKILNIVNNRYLFFVFLIVPLAVIVVFELRNLSKLAKRKEEEQKPENTEPPQTLE